MSAPHLAREYEVPKRPVFVLDDMEVVQSTDSAAYVSSSLTDSVMYGTNGNIGLRHCSEVETIGFKTQVIMNGVHHLAPFENYCKSSAIPQHRQVGAYVCGADLDCLVDGESGTLSSMPLRRLSLKDGAYRSFCEDVMSSDGGLIFDSTYVRTVSATDLSLWGAQAVCSNFRFVSPSTSTGGAGTADAMTQDDRRCNYFSSWSAHSGTIGNNNNNSSGRGSGVGGGLRSDTSTDCLAAMTTSRSVIGESYKLEFAATFTVDLEEWEVMKAQQMDEVWQRSQTSGILVNTTTALSCIVDYGTNKTRINPEVEIMVCSGDDDPASPISLDRFPSSVFGNTNANANKDQSGMAAAGGGVGSLTGGGVGGGAAASGGGGGGHLGGMSGCNITSSNTGGDSLVGSSGARRRTTYGVQFKDSRRRLVIRARFLFLLTEDAIPESVSLTFKARHYVGSVPPLRPFPSIGSIIESRRRSLEAFWATYDIDLQLQEELTPNRTRLSLLYNAFRLFTMSYNIEKGIPRAGCSAVGEGLQCDLSQYIYHGIYYTLTQPESALSLLKGLYAYLPQTRLNARNLCIPVGAVYPVTTITGINCKSNANVNNTQFHVNADIGYLVALYFSAAESISTEHRLMLLELMLETARVWPYIGDWQENRTVFRLDNIGSVDEYNTCSSGNFYVHLSAQEHMLKTVKLFQRQERMIAAEHVAALLERIAMTREEVLSLEEVSRAISIHRDDQQGVYLVHDNFHTLSEWTEERVKHPLHSNYHPLAIYRHKLVDIPDVLLGMLLYRERFERHEFERNLAYYVPLCTFDSPEALGIVAIAQCCARLNYAQPIPYLRSLSNLDLDNILYTAEEGLHFGAMSLSLVTLICGVGGVSTMGGSIYLNPVLPAGVSRYHFTICWRGAVLRTTLDAESLTYELVSGDSIRFIHGDTKNRIHLHTGFRRFEASRKLTIPRISFSQINQFEGAIVLCDAIFHNLLEYSYISWLRTLETLFDNFRTLHHRNIPPLNPEEFIEKVVYQSEVRGIAFSGIHNVLLARDINLELGTPDDAEIVETRYGLANAKLAEMAELMENQLPVVNPDIFALLTCLARSGVALAVVTYGRNLKQLMTHNPELASLFVARIDGEEAYDRQIRGRPHLDLYTCAAEKIHINPSRCIVIGHHLDRGYSAEDLVKFRMFLDVEDPFVSSRVSTKPYPTLDAEYVEKCQRDNPVVCRLRLAKIPMTIDEIEDVVDGRLLSGAD